MGGPQESAPVAAMEPKDTTNNPNNNNLLPDNNDTSTTTNNVLFQEIALLKERLQELDDARSTIGGGGMGDTMMSGGMASPLSTSWHPTDPPNSNHTNYTNPNTNATILLLRKELAKVEDDKARLQLELMNSIANLQLEKQAAVTDLQTQLQQAVSQTQDLQRQLQQQHAQQEERRHDETDQQEQQQERLRQELQDDYQHELRELQEVHGRELRRVTEQWHKAESELAHQTRDMTQLLTTVGNLQQAQQTWQTERHELQTQHEQALQQQQEDHAQAMEQVDQLLHERQVELEECRDDLVRMSEALEKAEHERDQALEHAGDWNDSLLDMEGQCVTLTNALQDTRQQLQTTQHDLEQVTEHNRALVQENQALQQQQQAQVESLPPPSGADQSTTTHQRRSPLTIHVEDPPTLAVVSNGTDTTTDAAATDHPTTTTTDLSVPHACCMAYAADQSREIGQAVELLEERLQSFQTRLREKDNSLQTMALQLQDEQRTNHALRKEIKYAKQKAAKYKYAAKQQSQHPPDAPTTTDPEDDHDPTATGHDIVELKRKNQAMADEIPALRQVEQQFFQHNDDDDDDHDDDDEEVDEDTRYKPDRRPDRPYNEASLRRRRRRSRRSHSTPPTPLPPLDTTAANTIQHDPSAEHVTELNSSTRSRLQHAWPPPAHNNPTPRTRRRMSFPEQDMLSSPRTPVSGLVASFERRITKAKEDESSSLVDSTVASTVTHTDHAETTHDDESHPALHRQIATLQRELDKERETVERLEQRIEKLSHSETRQGRENQFQVSRLQKEIETLQTMLQDSTKEMEHLESQLEREKKTVDDLRNEVSTATQKLQGASSMELKMETYDKETDRLQSQIDTLEDTRKSLVRETDELRRQLREERERVTHLRLDVESQTSQLEDLATLKTKLRDKEKEVARLRLESDCHDQNYQTAQQMVTDLQKKLTALSSMEKETTVPLQTELHEREQEIARLKMQVQTNQEIGKASDLQIEKLQHELTRLQDRSHTDEVHEQELDDLRHEIVALKDELNEAKVQLDQRRQLFEDNNNHKTRNRFVSTRDRGSIKKRTSSDEDYHRMKDELTKTQVARGEIEMNYMQRVKELEREIETVETEARQQLEEMQTSMDQMKAELEQRQADVERLEREKTQLCTSMTSASMSRSEDFEELQSELIERTTANKSQAREIQALKLKLEEHEKVKYGKEQQLGAKIAELEQEMALTSQGGRRHLEDFDKLQSENQQMRETIRQLKSERRHLQERLDSLLQDKSSSKSTQVLRERNASLRQEVERLNKRLRKMEESITRFAI